MKQKKILVISDLCIFPPRAGNTSRICELMNNLKSLGNEVTFLGLGLQEDEERRMRENWKNVFVIPYVRIREIRPIKSAVRRVLLGKLVSRDLYSPEIDFWYWPHWDTKIKEFLNRSKYDVVIVEYVFFSKALNNFGENILKIIDTHDVFTDRQKKLKKRGINRCFKYLSLKQEKIGLLRSDAIISIQDNEKKVIEEMVDRPVVTIGHTVNIKILPFQRKPNIVFVATDYEPNIDGINTFINECFPRIKNKVPNATLYIAGTICKSLKCSDPSVSLMGILENIEDAYLMGRAIINPVVVGTGLKTKSLEAMAYGRPLVSTQCGIEGLESGIGSSFLLAENMNDFSDHVINLLLDDNKAVSLAKGALTFVNNWNLLQLKNLEILISGKY